MNQYGARMSARWSTAWFSKGGSDFDSDFSAMIMWDMVQWCKTETVLLQPLAIPYLDRGYVGSSPLERTFHQSPAFDPGPDGLSLFLLSSEVLWRVC